MNEHAKKLWGRVSRKREELGAADFAVCQAEVARGALRQAVGELMVRFTEHVTELAVEKGLNPETARFNLESFEFEHTAPPDAAPNGVPLPFRPTAPAAPAPDDS